MLPMILVSKTTHLADEYIQTFVVKEKLSSLEVHRIHPLEKELSVEQIRELKKDLIIQQNTPHLFILDSFDRASLEAQNALLKTLEEQTVHHMILIVSNEDGVLPTVRSRSTTIVLREDKIELSEEQKITFSILEETLTKRVFAPLFSHPSMSGLNQQKAEAILNDVIFFFHSRMRNDVNATKVVKKTLSLVSLLRYNNMNAQLAVDTVLIFIFKTYKLKLK